MARILVHKPTGDRYIYTKIMAQRGDMELVDESDLSDPAEVPVASPPEPVEVIVEPEPKPEPKPKLASAAIDALFGVSDGEEEG